MGWIALIIHVQRSPTKRNRPVVHNCAQLRRHFLSNKTRECGRLLAIEIGLKTVPDGFVQENARPARGQNYLRWPSRGIDSTQLKNRLTSALPSKALRIQVVS